MWYYYLNGQQVGPVPLDTVLGLLSRGQLRADDLVWREGMPQWLPAREVPELARVTAAGAAAAPAPAYGAAHAPISYYTPTDTVEYAGFWLRFCAAFVDGIITGVLGAILGFLVIGLVRASGGDTDQNRAVAELGSNILSIIVTWLYSAFLESSEKQATLGKMALGIRVTDEAGQRISFARATGRHFGKFISFLILMIGYIMAAFTERKQALHDIMAGTLVVKPMRT